jgi:hypothetical protein
MVCLAPDSNRRADLVGGAEQREWHCEPKRLGGLEVYDEFVPCTGRSAG